MLQSGHIAHDVERQKCHTLAFRCVVTVLCGCANRFPNQNNNKHRGLVKNARKFAMAGLNVAEWTPDQVADWISGSYVIV